MSNDISSMYTKDQNKKAGRRGYLSWKHEKVTIIPPAAYGDYILQDFMKYRGSLMDNEQ